MTTALILTITHLLAASLLASLLAAPVFAPGAEAEGRTRRLFALCLASGAALALFAAALRRTTAINRGMVNLVILCAIVLVSAVFTVFLWMRVKAPGIRAGSKAWPLAALLAGLLALYALQPVFLMPWDFVPPGQSAFTTEALLSFTGAALGLALVTFAASALLRAARGLPPALFALFLSAALLAHTLRALANIIQFLTARRIIRPSRAVFRLYMTAINHEVIFTLAVAAIALLLALTALVALVKRQGDKAVFANPAQKRKHRAVRRLRFRWNAAALCAIAFCVFTITGLAAWNAKEVVLSPAEPMAIDGGEALIPQVSVDDGRLHRFAWNAGDGTEVRFIVIKKSAASYGVGLDACDICGNTGYYERRDGVVCRLCDVVMNISTIGFKGGCNPVPLAYRLREGAMVINLDDLEKERGRFK